MEMSKNKTAGGPVRIVNIKLWQMKEYQGCQDYRLIVKSKSESESESESHFCILHLPGG